MKHQTTWLGMLFICMSSLVCLGQSPAFRWVDTFVFEGTGVMESEPLVLWSSKWKVKYYPLGALPFELQLRDLKTTITKQITRQLTGKPVPGVFHGSKPFDCACLSVHGSEKGWKIVVSQYMDRVDEWHFKQWKGWDGALLPLASWCGEPGDRQFIFDMPDWAGRLSIVQQQEGYLRVDILNQEGTVLFRTISTKPGERFIWLYDHREYTIKVTAVDTNWNIHVDTLSEPPSTGASK